MSATLKLTCGACGQANRVPASKLGAGPKCGICGDGLVTGRVAELDLATHDKMVRGDELPLIVDYWAPWCGPCKMMAPEFAKAAKTLAPGLRCAKIDTEAHPKIAQRLAIRGIPLLILWHRGREVARAAGMRPSAEIAAFAREKLGALA